MEEDKINVIVDNLNHKPEMAKELIRIYDGLVSEIVKTHKRLQNGRDYLMQVEPDDISVEDCLESFGYGRNG